MTRVDGEGVPCIVQSIEISKESFILKGYQEASATLFNGEVVKGFTGKFINLELHIGHGIYDIDLNASYEAIYKDIERWAVAQYKKRLIKEDSVV